MTETPSTKQQAQEAAGTAADEGKHVASVAAGQAKDVAGEAKAHARNLVGEAQGQLDEQTRTQRDRLVGTLQSFSDDLEQMASSGQAPGLAADVARQVADRTRSLGQHLDGREPSDILDDVRRFARQRPGTFLLGALAAGVLVGRVARGAKDAASDDTGSGLTQTTPPGGPSPYDSPYDSPTSAPGTAVPSSRPASPPTANVAPGTPTGAPVAPPADRIDDPLSAADPALGADVPPSATGRFEP
jgi:plasmid stabilization system protein ParE